MPARAARAEIRTARRRASGRSWAPSTSSSVSRHFTGARIGLNEFPDQDIPLSAVPASRAWPAEGLARVPYWIYQDEDVYTREQERIYRGDTWNFLGLYAELLAKGDFKTTFVGEMPVVVTRDETGAIRCFENRCAHRGALLCLADRGNAKEIACVYHNWTYDLRGDLTAVAFRRGVQGKGGMPADAEPESQAPRKFRVEIFCGLMFATLSGKTPSIERYIGPEVAARIRRVMKEPVKIRGGVTLQILTVFPGFVLQQIMNSLAVRQVLPKGVRRTELVWTCFGYASDDARMTELRMMQANLVGPAGYISLEDGAATGFVQRGAAGASERSSFVEMGGRTVESNESRVTETSVRGLWQQYRRHMGL